MPRPITNTFSEFEFTTEEFYQATRFSQLSLHLIQTLLAQTAAQRLSLKVDTKDPTEWIQAEAALKGTMEAYENLLDLFATTEAPQSAAEAVEVKDTSNIGVNPFTLSTTATVTKERQK